MERTCDYAICTGCGVCYTVCPKKCISFVKGDFGHFYPKIDTSECIDCKKCQKVCPAINRLNQIKPEKAYAAIIKDERDYVTSTSGGAAQAFSSYTIENGGVVYGCASLPNAKIEHIRVDNLAQLELLKGSKYVQSNALNIYQSLIKDVCEGKDVLFIGTPCQCAAIKSLYKIQPDNLCLIDLICHGVPSQAFLHRYLMKQGLSLQDIDRLWFRTDCGYQIVASKKLQSGIYQPIYKSVPLRNKKCRDIYYRTFMYGYSCRPSCYKCKYACPDRCSDVTIGDFWGLGKNHPVREIPDHPHGISVILPCTKKGYEIMDKVSEMISLYERLVEEAMEGNSQLQYPMSKGADVKIFDLLKKVIGIRSAFEISFFLRRLSCYIFHRLRKLQK